MASVLKGFTKIQRKATPPRLSFNLFIIMKSGRGAWSPWRTPDPDIPFKNIIMKSGEEAETVRNS